MTKFIIFLDLDGVISDFTSHAAKCDKYKDNGKLDYNALTYDWWASMPVFEGALEFYKELKKLAEVKFLTGPMINSDCYSGKATWIENFDPDRGKFTLLDLIICPSKAKYLLAAKNRILIDDRKDNIKDWQNAGGLGIQHTGDFKKTLDIVKKIILQNTLPQKISS